MIHILLVIYISFCLSMLIYSLIAASDQMYFTPMELYRSTKMNLVDDKQGLPADVIKYLDSNIRQIGVKLIN